MTSTELERPAEQPAPVSRPTRIGQATAVEQSRAMAEVQAAVVVAQQCPRNTQAALAEMRESCRQMRLAERAFYRFSRGGAQVSGPTVHLARELARVWGNVQYGIAELSRDDQHGQSEMQAWAWDLQTNTRSSQVFIVPHMRDKRGGPERLTDMRSIYEENTNQGSRRLRQAIWSVLPPWLVDEAVEICNKTLEDGGDVPLAKRIAATVNAFQQLGVSTDQLERKAGRPTSKWTPHDIAQMNVVGKSIQRNETTVDDEFPPERVTAADITGHPAPPETVNPATGEVEPEPDGGWPDVPPPGSKSADA